MTSSFVLSDGLRELDFLDGGNIYVAADGLNIPVPDLEHVFSESALSEGRSRLRSRALNSEQTFTVYVRGSDESEFWDAVDDLQELVASAHKRKGTIRYTAPRNAPEVTWDLEAIRVSGLPQRGVTLRVLHIEVEVTYEAQPYGRLPDRSLTEPPPFVNYRNSVLGLTPEMAISLGASNGLVDQTPNGRNGTGAGSISVGGQTGPLVVDDEGATLFDGSDDAVTFAPQPWSNSVSHSFCGWFKFSSLAAVGTLFGASSTGPSFCVTTSGGLRLRPQGNMLADQLTWAAGLTTGVWYHIALVVDRAANEARVYVDGTLISSQALVSYPLTSGTFQIGRRSSGGSSNEFLDGNAAWVSWHPGTLTAGQVAALRQAGLAPLPAKVALAGPIDSMLVEGVAGHVDAFGRLVLEDTSSVSSDFLEVGLQAVVDPDDPEPVLLAAVTDLSGLAAGSNTRSGSVSTNVLRATLNSGPLVLCTSGALPHKGWWKPRARVYGSAADIRVQLQWRVGKGGWTSEKWVSVPAASAWFVLDLGTVNIRELPDGHSWEARIVAAARSGVPTLDVDTLALMPCDRYFVGRGFVESNPTSVVVASDDFDGHSAGALTGKTPQVTPSGNWSGAGDSDDFYVSTGIVNAVYRPAVSDSNINSGRYCRLGSGTLAATEIRVWVWVGSDVALSTSVLRVGVFARYIDTNNWFMVAYDGVGTLSIRKRVSGTVTTLAEVPISNFGSERLRVIVGTNGGWAVLTEPGAWVAVSFTADSDLATGGALASGGYGIYHANTTSSPIVPLFTDFSVFSSSLIPQPALVADHATTLKHDDALTETATETGRTPIREGDYLKIPPATRAELTSRIVVRRRRLDINAGLPDTGLTDTLDASLNVTERVTLTKP